jgi:hypothetical protein
MKKLLPILICLLALPAIVLAMPEFTTPGMQNNNTEYRPSGTTYGFSINITDTDCGVPCIQTVNFQNNFNGTNHNTTLVANGTDAVFMINFTYPTNVTTRETLYTYKWWAGNGTSGIVNDSSSYGFYLQKNQTVQVCLNISVYGIGGVQTNVSNADARSYQGQGLPYADCWMGTACDGTGQTLWGTTSLYRDETSWTKGSGGALSLSGASNTVKCNSTGNTNYTDNATGCSYTLSISPSGGGTGSPDVEPSEEPTALPPGLIQAPSQAIGKAKGVFAKIAEGTWRGFTGIMNAIAKGAKGLLSLLGIKIW